MHTGRRPRGHKGRNSGDVSSSQGTVRIASSTGSWKRDLDQILPQSQKKPTQPFQPPELDPLKETLAHPIPTLGEPLTWIPALVTLTLHTSPIDDIGAWAGYPSAPPQTN